MRHRSIGLVVALVAGLFAAPFVSGAQAQGMTNREKELYEAAKAEGSVTWYVAQYTTSTAEKVGEGFSKRYPGLKTNIIRSTGQVAYSRLQQDLRAKVAQCDVFTATDITHALELKKNKLLMHYVPENAAKMVETLKDLDPDGYFYTTSANPTIMIYNTNLVKKDDVPTNWTDLVAPKWKNKVSISHPGFSGSTGSWALMMEKLYGWQFFDKLEANNPQIGRSLTDPISVVTSGERQIGIAPYAQFLESKSKGNPIDVIFPTDGAKLTRGPTFILANAPHPNTAKLFMEFLLSVQGAEILVGDGHTPLRPEVPPPPGAKLISEIKMGPMSEAEVAGIPQLIERWRATFGN